MKGVHDPLSSSNVAARLRPALVRFTANDFRIESELLGKETRPIADGAHNRSPHSGRAVEGWELVREKWRANKKNASSRREFSQRARTILESGPKSGP